MDETPVIADLRAWGKGLYGTEAAVELLARAFGGRFAEPGWPWIKDDDQGRAWLDAEEILGHAGVLSGGERRVLEVVASLAGVHTVNLMDVMSSLDRQRATLVLAALSHAAGVHEEVQHVEGPGAGSARVQLGAVVDWPPA